MERDTRRLALISVGLGIGIVTLMPVRAGLAEGFRPDAFSSLGTAVVRNLGVTDALDLLQNILLFLPLGYFAAATAGTGPGLPPKTGSRGNARLKIGVSFSDNPFRASPFVTFGP